MNPHDNKQWIAVFKDGRTSFNEGKGYTFDAGLYTKWCAENFGTVEVIGKETATNVIEGRSELEDGQPRVELDTKREATELEANAPMLPPRIPEHVVELQDRGGPKELPATPAHITAEKSPEPKSPSILGSRLSKLKLRRSTPSSRSRNGPAELEG